MPVSYVDVCLERNVSNDSRLSAAGSAGEIARTPVELSSQLDLTRTHGAGDLLLS